ncbi:sugar phosphate nucleotidyltransferase [uncultured Dysosmobacter sp.]|uniref:nucleotidyltransferase family protein n=1 Tax=uncultured Dysosmobacter sp. TaxID=2591384 RepID=UPI002673DA7A|nr:sugar phosphate nucleotidyltransferase [uncultured Dysosmobacter sp.]
MHSSLVIMAAGLGSRYGGSKQVDGIGPNGEILMEYSIHDALRAGFDKVVFIIKPEMQEMMDGLVGYLKQKKTADGRPVEVAFVYQDFTSVPSFYRIPEERTKPFGTVHALLCAEPAVDGPFCVINADDYYGVDAYRTIYEELGKLAPSGESTMVGYLLKNTASLHGTVSRGVCKVKDGKLDSIQETLKIQLYPDGHLTDLDTNTDLDPETVVSMNFWGFMPSIFPALRAYFEAFLRGLPDGAVKAECLLPVMVGEELKAGRMTVSVLNSRDKWFGMTYHEDRALVAEDLQKLHEAGVYPPSLRN